MGMSVSCVAPPASAGDTAARRCEYYWATCGLPAQLVEGNRIALRLGGLLGAVTMPAALGRKVAPSLRVRAMPAPALAHPGGERWTFLSGPGSATLEHVAALVPLGVSVVGDNALVVLPSPETEALDLWRWVDWPTRADLPAQAALLATTRALAISVPAVRSGKP
ncbi:hypothetical protein SacmaDRAFT_4185 [Saccharomonospora marina XMU15]|uniref:Uncharacterized protein n=1 Tax=Saccharomonospora marina XMU15 TaxID=882083 RepID=H5X6U9_9PSEU|nr:hypothetical protein [Saccharomonospora marina]EHR52378.1 hypothetical protein SacmaDRAFT_4185 [Saccharomonospora marina XMU15]